MLRNRLVALFLPPLEFLSHYHSQLLDFERLSHGLDYVALPFGEIHDLVDTRNHNSFDIRVNLLHSLQEFQSPVGRFGDTVCRVWDIHPPFREILLKILEGHPGILPANLRAVPQLTMRGGSDSLTVRRT